MSTQDKRAELRALLETKDGLRQLREWIVPAVFHVLGTNQDANDVTEEVFLRLWKECHAPHGAESQREINHLKAWVGGVARHVALDSLQNTIRQQEIKACVDSDEGRAGLAPSLEPKETTDTQYDDVTYRQRLIEASYKDLRRITVERGLWGGIKPEEIAKRLGTNRNHVYQLRFRLRNELARRTSLSTDPERIGGAIEQIAISGGPDAHHLAHLILRRLAGCFSEKECTEQLAVIASPTTIRPDVCASGDVSAQAVAASLARKGVRLAELLWFIDDPARLPLCEKLAWFVYRTLKSLVELVTHAASPRLMDFVLRSRSHNDASTDQIQQFLFHLKMIDMAARIDRRLIVRATVLYMAEQYRDNVDYLDLHDPAWVRDYFMSLIDGCRRIPQRMEAYRWLGIVAFGRHLASAHLGQRDLDNITPARERFQTLTRLGTAFAVNEVARDWEEANAVFVYEWPGAVAYKTVILKAPAAAQDSKVHGSIHALLPAVMDCLENDSPLAMFAGIRELVALKPSNLNTDFASAAMPRILALSRVAPRLPLIAQAWTLCDRVVNGPHRRRVSRKS